MCLLGKQLMWLSGKQFRLMLSQDGISLSARTIRHYRYRGDMLMRVRSIREYLDSGVTLQQMAHIL